MIKQCLDVQQMQHLQELGLELNKQAMLSWLVDEREKDKPLLCISSEAVDYVDFSHYCLPAYTLQDVLDALTIEIKQTKEDMEEKKQCGDTRFRIIARAKEHLFQATNIAEDKKELEVLDSFLLRCWQMGWLKQYEDAEEKKIQHYDCFFDRKPTLKEFDLEAAKADKPVCTRDGRKARIICFNLQSIEKTPIVAAVQVTDKQEVISHYYEDGRQFVDGKSELDLMMLPEKKEGWINVYKERCYETKEEAIRHIAPGTHYIDTIRVEWEDKE